MDALLECRCGEELAQVHTGIECLKLLGEYIHKVVLTAHCTLAGGVEGRCECGVSGVVGKGLDHVGDGNLQDDVHTALEVQTETDLVFTALLV